MTVDTERHRANNEAMMRTALRFALDKVDSLAAELEEANRKLDAIRETATEFTIIPSVNIMELLDSTGYQSFRNHPANMKRTESEIRQLWEARS